MQHPPVYAMPPVITSLDYSPDGKLLAVAGFHEVLLHKADGSGIEARLVGLCERIQSVRFSPDGTKLAVAGGSPGRMGEIQVWDVAKKKLDLSVRITFDTLYGASWSPDGKLVAFGGADNAVRAIDAATGKQVALQPVRTTTGCSTPSGARRETSSPPPAATWRRSSSRSRPQRFVDNITSITPGALRGGMHALARHPQRDEILIGGADGVPQIYRMVRVTVRRIGDDANLIRKFPADGRPHLRRRFLARRQDHRRRLRLPRKGRGELLQLRHGHRRCPTTSRRSLEQVGSGKDPKVVSLDREGREAAQERALRQGHASLPCASAPTARRSPRPATTAWCA